MQHKNIPEDINVELILSYFPEGKCKVGFKGLHKRNSYKDIIDIKDSREGNLILDISRHSLYNSLPEYMFHPVERYGSLTKKEDQKRFTEEYELQEEERERALRFFAPVDLLLLKLRVQIREKLQAFSCNDKILVDILADGLTEKQKSNRFIRQALYFLPSCKHIRGDKSLINLMLRKIFMEEGLLLEKHDECMIHQDISPRYDDCIGASLDSCYAGNIYDQIVTTYDLHYWSEDDCDENFQLFVNEVEEFRSFVQDYFISIEEILRFDISCDGPPLRLSDEMVYNYLDYNTNI